MCFGRDSRSFAMAVLYFLIPFYILRFEKILKSIEKNNKKRDDLITEYREMFEKISKSDVEYLNEQYVHDIVNLMNRIVEYVAKDCRKVKEEETIMGGQVLEMESDIIKSLGIERGQRQGKSTERRVIIYEQLMELGEIPEYVKKRIEEEDDLEILRKWTRIALRAESMEAFWKEIERKQWGDLT